MNTACTFRCMEKADTVRIATNAEEITAEESALPSVLVFPC